MPYANVSGGSFGGISVWAQVRGLRDIKGRFASIPQSVKHYMANAFFGRYIHVHQEPGPKPGSRYKRTHKLYHGWEKPNSELGKTGNWFIVSNPVPYAPYVQGDKQRGFHAQTGWHVMDTSLDKIMEDLDREIQAGLGGP